jgi:hypothetical protein
VAAETGASPETLERYLRFAEEASSPLRDAARSREIQFEVAYAMLDSGLGKLRAFVQSEVIRNVIERDLCADEARTLVRTLTRSIPERSEPLEATRAPQPWVHRLADGTLILNVLGEIDDREIVARVETALRHVRRSRGGLPTA